MSNLNDGLLSGHACRSMNADVEVHFRNLEKTLLLEMEKADIILGCVAWVTSYPILKVLAEKTSCLILDHKVPSMPEKRKVAYKKIQEQDKTPIYEMLRNGHGYGEYFSYSTQKGFPLEHTVYGDWNFEAGLYRVDGGRFRYMHHKFLIMIKKKGLCTCGRILYEPTVWTGSFNLTTNAKTGLENAMVIRDPAVCAAYLAEFLEVHHHHALQMNVTGQFALTRGWSDTDSGKHMPLCRRSNYFPFKWFIPCYTSRYIQITDED